MSRTFLVSSIDLLLRWRGCLASLRCFSTFVVDGDAVCSHRKVDGDAVDVDSLLQGREPASTTLFVVEGKSTESDDARESEGTGESGGEQWMK